MKVGVDVGGTFTDVVVVEDGTPAFGKVSTVPGRPQQGVFDGLERMGVRAEAVEHFVHGSTIALNAILERRGVATALVTTRGFRDVLEIMRTNRPDLYNLQQEKPVPLVPRSLRLEVRERVSGRGEVVEPIAEEDLEAAAAAAEAAGVQAIAVCFLNSYVDDVHELRAKAFLEARLPGVSVMASSEFVREWREFERTSTAVVNAYIRPLVDEYARAVGDHVGDGNGASAPVFMMQSNGGLGSAMDVGAQPATTIMSGPVGGIIAAEGLARATGCTDLLTLDIGGTSADMCLITDGRGKVVSQREIDRFPVLAATVDVHSIGAGGGSIAFIDRGGGLQVGPRSAGARPGPACYGRGGTEPTVTDAHVVLGHIDPAHFLGGEMELDVERARESVGQIASALRFSPERAAAGIIRVIDLRMVEAVRRLAARGGHDLRDYTLVAFGGAGGLHGAQLCRELGVGRMIVPVGPGTFSALGMLMADLRRDYAHTSVVAVTDEGHGDVESVFARLEARARAAEPPGDASFVRVGDLRYEGQEFTVDTPAPATITREAVGDLRASFEERHERLYGYRLEGRRIELVTARVSVVTPSAAVALAPLDTGGAAEDARTRTAQVFDALSGATGTWPVYERGRLAVGASFAGPAIVEEPQATTIAGHGDRVQVDRYGNLVVAIAGGSS